MRIAFVGKGGSGKTTTAAAFGRYLAARGRPVVAVNADINQHLAVALGHDGPAPRPLGADLPWLKDHHQRRPLHALDHRRLPPAQRRRLGDRATGTDLAAQVDPEFVPGPLVRS